MKFRKYLRECVETTGITLDESISDMDRRCEKCNTLLNDGGTCPKCDDGEEDYGDEKDLEESVTLTELTNREKLKKAYPELNFDDTANITEDVHQEALSNKEKLKRAYPELNFDEPETMTEDISNKEKLKRAYPELNFDTKLTESEADEDEDFEDMIYDDEYELEDDDVEMDRAHAALYGGDRMYCDCGHLLSMNEWGSYCPVCDPQDPEDAYDDEVEYLD